jgi:uncharacterized protein
MAHPPSSKAPWYLPALLLFLAGCGSSTQFYRSVEDHVSAGRYAEAIQGINENRNAYGDRSTVLYNLDLGLIYHYAGMIDSSNVHLLAAEREIEELYTKSVSLAAMSFLLNDNVLPYDGEDFERVLINIFLALNYAQQGLPDEALVEARKVDLKMREFVSQYEGKNKYQEDALARYLAGALYESGGEINDAFISYKKSYEAYETYKQLYHMTPPRFLLDDLVRMAKRLGFTEEYEKYVGLGGKHPSTTDTRQGSLIVVAYAGRAPVKTEVRPSVSVADSAGVIHTFQIALPKFTARMTVERSYDVSLRTSGDSSGRVSARTVIAEDITAIADQSLEDRLALVYLKSGGRALLKFLAAEGAKSKLKEKSENTLVNILGSIAIDLAVGATEQADIRCWRTLPAQIQLARLELTPGSYEVTVDAADREYRLSSEPVTIKPGKVSFLIVEDVR